MDNLNSFDLAWLLVKAIFLIPIMFFGVIIGISGLIVLASNPLGLLIAIGLIIWLLQNKIWKINNE